MTLRSLINQDGQFTPIEVEFSFLPGLPGIQIVGLPDAAIKESVLKIKSAIRLQGFEIPRGKTVVVNLRPSHIKKSSQGIELAIALGILLNSNQLRWPDDLDLSNSLFYGEINLSGEVHCPPDVEWFSGVNDELIVTGNNKFMIPNPQYQIDQLLNFNSGQKVNAQDPCHDFNRPQLPNLTFSKSQARLMEIISAGEHSALLAGPSGTGKSTVVDVLRYLVQPPSKKIAKEIRQVWRERVPQWRPVVSPHHSVTPLAMIGGGVPPRFGDITRAHGGLLIMDEFLEYNREVVEALREPMEAGQITISRSGYEKLFHASFLLLATTNLCPCGFYVPKRHNKCTCASHRRSNYLSRLNGPVLDRFSIISFSDEWESGSDDTIGLPEILRRVDRATAFSREVLRQDRPNHFNTIDEAAYSFLLPKTTSRRRLKFVHQIARTIADLDENEEIKPFHIEEAVGFCLKSHQLLTSQLSLY